MFVYFTDFILGAFVGLFALAAFSPVRVARTVYTVSWGVGALFVLVSYLGKGSGPAPFIAANQPNTTTLIIVVLCGIGASIGRGLAWMSSQKSVNDVV